VPSGYFSSKDKGKAKRFPEGGERETRKEKRGKRKEEPCSALASYAGQARKEERGKDLFLL